MSFRYEHTPYAVNADDNQPLFFRRRYGGNPEPSGSVSLHGRPMTVISLAPDEPIYIYGYSYDWSTPRIALCSATRGSALGGSGPAATA